MIDRKRRYSLEEAARRGQEIFDRKIAPLVKDEDPMKFVAIDIETEDFDVDADRHVVGKRLLEASPDAQIWMRRVGYPVADWIGCRPPSDKPRWRRLT